MGCCAQVSLEESYNPQIALDVFKEDPDFQQSEKEYEVSHPPSQKSLERHTGKRISSYLHRRTCLPCLVRRPHHAIGLCSCETS